MPITLKDTAQTMKVSSRGSNLSLVSHYVTPLDWNKIQTKIIKRSNNAVSKDCKKAMNSLYTTQPILLAARQAISVAMGL